MVEDSLQGHQMAHNLSIRDPETNLPAGRQVQDDRKKELGRQPKTPLQRSFMVWSKQVLYHALAPGV